jgi:hypothetical protein
MDDVMEDRLTASWLASLSWILPPYFPPPIVMNPLWRMSSISVPMESGTQAGMMSKLAAREATFLACR